jgi:hypothetical protein
MAWKPSLKRFKVLVHGQNFWIPIDGKITPANFYTTRYVDAKDPLNAGELVVESLFKEEKLTVRQNPPDAPPTIKAEKVEEVGWSSKRFGTALGFTFYIEDKDGSQTH